MSNSNMYEWVDRTWNPLAGECPHKCSYCSTHKLSKRWEAVRKKYSGSIRIDFNQIQDKLGNSKTVFVVGQNDLFASDVPAHYIYTILNMCKYWNNNSYLFQSKNPQRFIDFLHEFPINTVLCTTIETNREYPEIMGTAPVTIQRAFSMSQIYNIKKFVTIEPILDFDFGEMVELIRMCEPEVVNIGADSGHNNLPEPSKEKVLKLIAELNQFTNVIQKNNLKRLIL